MKIQTFVAVSAAVAATVQPAAAQTLQDLAFDRSSEIRMTAGVTIPLGGQPILADSKPRFDLGFARYRQRNDAVWLQHPTMNAIDQQWRTTKLSLTFEDNPRMMMNGRQVGQFDLTMYADDDGGNSTTLIVGGVLLAGLGVTIATITDGVDAIEDLTDPD